LAGIARAIQLCAATGTAPKPKPQTATSAMVSGRAPAPLVHVKPSAVGLQAGLAVT